MDRPEKWTPTLIIDTETTTDAVQHLLFGVYRYCRWTKDGVQECREEGVFYADDLPEFDPAAFATLRTYVRTSVAAGAAQRGYPLRFLSRRDFMNRVFFKLAFRARALVVGFNLPFDLSRIAINASAARGKRHAGGISLALFDYHNRKTGRYRESKTRPRLIVQAHDSKRAFIEFKRMSLASYRDRIPDGAPEGRAVKTYRPRGRFLDLRTTAFALTNESYNLRSAGVAFRAKVLKSEVEQHGEITPAYIDYARNDVHATQALLDELRAEFDLHPTDLRPDQARSPASIAKAYLAALGLTPPMRRSTLSLEQIGATMSAYFGGRSECRIRCQPVPVVYVDFLSMYPTVNTLMNLWQILTAKRIDAVDATEDVRALLSTVSPERAFDQTFWPALTCFVLVEPDDNILPLRTQYGHGKSFNIGINRVTSRTPLWYALPDVVASTLLTGKAPKIVSAFRVVPVGKLPTLTPVALRGQVPIDPTVVDFFRVVTEERQRLKTRTDIPKEERERLKDFLKVVGNTGSYGIFAEMNPQTVLKGKAVDVKVYGHAPPFLSRCKKPEQPGRYCFPPLAALIASGARLMLALLERSVTDAGGHYASCDTDSMTIVATERGGLVPCVGGAEMLDDGRQAIRALSWSVVQDIVRRFRALNPYDPKVVQDILKIEDENFDKMTGQQRENQCYVISAKRYCLFYPDAAGNIIDIPKFSEHGLGVLLDPLGSEGNAKRDPREWIIEAWRIMVGRALGQVVKVPKWYGYVAASRLPITKATMLNPFRQFNKGKPYGKRVKPFGFVLSAHTVWGGCPTTATPDHFHLIRAFDRRVHLYDRLPWINRYTGVTYDVTTAPDSGEALSTVARVQSYGTMLRSYETHPEPKSAAPNGAACDRTTKGLLGRRHIHVSHVILTGKETNEIQQVAAGAVQNVDEVQVVYTEPNASGATGIPSILANLPNAEIARRSGLSLSAVKRLRTRKPQRRTLAKLQRVAADIARENASIELPADDAAACAAFDALPDALKNDEHRCRRCGKAHHGRGDYCASAACRQAVYRQRKGRGGVN